MSFASPPPSPQSSTAPLSPSFKLTLPFAAKSKLKKHLARKNHHSGMKEKVFSLEESAKAASIRAQRGQSRSASFPFSSFCSSSPLSDIPLLCLRLLSLYYTQTPVISKPSPSTVSRRSKPSPSPLSLERTHASRLTSPRRDGSNGWRRVDCFGSGKTRRRGFGRRRRGWRRRGRRKRRGSGTLGGKGSKRRRRRGRKSGSVGRGTMRLGRGRMRRGRGGESSRISGS